MIFIEVLNTTWYPGQDLKLKKYHDFELFLADIFVKKLANTIDKQRYVKWWKPLSSKYLLWKARNGYSLNIWECTGDMKAHFKVKNAKKKGKRVVVGFNKNLRHKKSGLKYEVLASILEFGSPTRRIPPRPLFRYVLNNMRKGLNRWYNVFQQQGTPKYNSLLQRELRR